MERPQAAAVSERPLDSIADEFRQLCEEVEVADKKIILVVNKIDKSPMSDSIAIPDGFNERISISAKSRTNIEAIRDALTRCVAERGVNDSTLLTNARHYDLMMKIADDIDRIEEGLTGGLPTDLVAIDVRSALDKLGRLTGTITDNDVLNTVFGRFCIGK